MSDTSDRISALKIDRTAATPAGGGRLWLLIPSALIIGLVGGFLPALRAARLPVAQALREL